MIDLKSQFSITEPEIRNRIDAVLLHGQYIMGPEVEEMEEALCRMTGARHCVSVSSGTDALLVSLMALNLKPGDEVITTPFTFAATAEVIALLGATPIFVDVDPRTCNIDASKLADSISSKTKAIIPVSLYGQPADLDEINEIAARHGQIPVIEDGAQSFGATYRGRKSCNLSTIGCTSFFPSKPLGCFGDGGAIFTDDDMLASACREIRVHGQSGRYNHVRIGIGGRMDTLQCAVVLAKLPTFERECGARLEVARRYQDLLAQPAMEGEHYTVLPWPAADRTSVFAQYTIRCQDRERVRRALLDNGIATAVHYPSTLVAQSAYAKYCCAECIPIASELAREVLSIPMHPYLTPEVQHRIVDIIKKAN